MRPARLAIAFLIGLVGAVWLGQGLGLIDGSVMSGSLVWAVAGVVLIAVAVVLVARERRRTW